MFQERTMLISLDIYDTPIVSVIAKQYDSNSRFVEAVCTENGVKFSLNSEEHKAIIVCNKPDDTVVVNDATILSNGNVLIELTQQMLAVHGRCTCDVMILSADGEYDVENSEVTILSQYALSTMSFYLEVKPFATSNEVIESTNEFKTFVNYLSESMVIEKDIEANEKERQAKEEERKRNEATRQTNTQTAINSCNTATTYANNAADACNEATTKANIATDNVSEAISEAENATVACNEATEKANTATTNANNATSACINATQECVDKTALCVTATTNANNATSVANTATTNANNSVEACNEATEKANIATDAATQATQRAIQAAEDCEGIADGTSVVLKSDLYDQNSLVKNSKLNTTFTEQEKQVIVSGEELSIILGKIAAYMNAFDNRQQILWNADNPSAEPDNSVGNNGDNYVKVIQE